MAHPERRREVVTEHDDAGSAAERGRCALERGDVAGAVACLERAHARAPTDTDAWLTLGIAYKRGGAVQRAIAAFRGVLELEPRLVPAWLNLARALREAGERGPALEAFRRALELDAGHASAWSMYSNALREQGALGAALDAARRALELDPFFGEAHLNEGAALHLSGRFDEAAASYFAASGFETSRGAALANLRALLPAAPRADCQRGGTTALALVGELLRRGACAERTRALAAHERARGRTATALACVEHAARLAPSAAAYHELARELWRAGRVDAAIARVVTALGHDPGNVAAYRSLTAWLCRSTKLAPLAPELSALLERCPDDVIALVNAGVALQRRGQPSAAVRMHQRALALDPQKLEAQLNLGAALGDLGELAQAARVYRELLAQSPERWDAHSNLLFSLHADPEQTPATLLGEHVAYGRRLRASLGPPRASFPHARDPERRLRVGYVSPDLRQHPVAYFLEPVLREHDESHFEIHCYSDAERHDATSERLAGLVTAFHDVSTSSDEELAGRLEQDAIDILVDLAGHTARNRLPVFARKPSPVSLSWIGYFGTTGVDAIDYRIVDEHSLGPEAERGFVEKLVRLPRSANCFLPPLSPPLAPPPSLRRGRVTFGCFNNPAKITRSVVAVFARVLSQVEGSRLLLKYGAYSDRELAARYRGWFAEEGIAEQRLELAGHSSMRGFLESFADVDIALDPFPYAGETTALHTLWMGVPLVTLAGPTLAELLSSRVLRVAGLGEWVARSRDEYVAIASALAASPAALAELRPSVRARLEASPLLDHRGVTRELEALYRELWRRYCARA